MDNLECGLKAVCIPIRQLSYSLLIFDNVGLQIPMSPSYFAPQFPPEQNDTYTLLQPNG